MMQILALTIFALFGSPAKAAITTGAAASALSVWVGFDPMPWVAGAAGGAIIFLKTEHQSRKETAANGLISVMLGGLVAPWLVRAAEIIVGKDDYGQAAALVNQHTLYAICFLLAAFWPLFYRVLWPVVMRKIGAEESAK